MSERAALKPGISTSTGVSMGTSGFARLDFHGLDGGPECAEALYDAVLKWFAQCGRVPDFVTLRGAGHRATDARFKGAHAKLLKSGFAGLVGFELNVEGPKTHYDVNMDWSLSASYWNLAEPQASIRLFAQHGLCSLGAESMLAPAAAVIRVARPQYGIGVDGSSPSGAAAEAILHEIGTEDSTSRTLRGKAWRHALLPGLHPWNFVSERQLAATLDGATLGDWIRARPDRGDLTALSDGLSLWAVAPRDLGPVFVSLWHGGVIFDARRHAEAVERVVAGPASDAPRNDDVPAIDRHKRDALLRRLRPAFENDDADPVASLEDFFDGNGDEWSLAPNARDVGRPPLARCLEVLREIRARSDVQDVLVAIHRPLDPARESDRWPRSDTVFIVAAREPSAIEEWTQALVPDEVTDLGACWSLDSIATPPGAPALQAGMRVHRLWWD